MTNYGKFNIAFILFTSVKLFLAPFDVTFNFVSVYEIKLEKLRWASFENLLNNLDSLIKVDASRCKKVIKMFPFSSSRWCRNAQHKSRDDQNDAETHSTRRCRCGDLCNFHSRERPGRIRLKIDTIESLPSHFVLILDSRIDHQAGGRVLINTSPINLFIHAVKRKLLLHLLSESSKTLFFLYTSKGDWNKIKVLINSLNISSDFSN